MSELKIIKDLKDERFKNGVNAVKSQMYLINQLKKDIDALHELKETKPFTFKDIKTLRTLLDETREVESFADPKADRIMIFLQEIVDKIYKEKIETSNVRLDKIKIIADGLDKAWSSANKILDDLDRITNIKNEGKETEAKNLGRLIDGYAKSK